MQTTAPATRAQGLATDIESVILRRQLGPGAALGTIDEWRRKTGFARATVSEAVRILVERGYVEIRPGRGGGLFVARAGAVVRLRRTLLAVDGDPSAVADAIAVREALEPLIVADATRSRSERDIVELRSLLVTLQSSIGDRERFMRANWALHERVAEISPNRVLSAVYLRLTELIRDSALLAFADDETGSEEESYSLRRYRAHEAIIDAIVAGNLAAAAEAVSRHER